MTALSVVDQTLSQYILARETSTAGVFSEAALQKRITTKYQVCKSKGQQGITGPPSFQVSRTKPPAFTISAALQTASDGSLL